MTLILQLKKTYLYLLFPECAHIQRKNTPNNILCAHDLFISRQLLVCFWRVKKNKTISWDHLVHSHQRPQHFKLFTKIFKNWLQYDLKSSSRNVSYELQGQMYWFLVIPAQAVSSCSYSVPVSAFSLKTVFFSVQLETWQGELNLVAHLLHFLKSNCVHF